MILKFDAQKMSRYLLWTQLLDKNQKTRGKIARVGIAIKNPRVI
jgi:hypothetical protein